jgi:hypothetical protein
MNNVEKASNCFNTLWRICSKHEHMEPENPVAKQTRSNKHAVNNTGAVVVRAEAVARQQPAASGLAGWEPQQTCTQQQKSCAWSVPRGYKSVVQLERVVEREWEWSESSALRGSVEDWLWVLVINCDY